MRAVLLAGLLWAFTYPPATAQVNASTAPIDSSAPVVPRLPRRVPPGTFEGDIVYRLTWWGPLAADYGRLLPSQLTLTVRGRQVRSVTEGGLYAVVSLLDADSARSYALDTLTRSAWWAPTPPQPRQTLSASAPAAPVAGQATVSLTAVFTWPDPRPDLPKPEDYKPTQVVQQLRVAPGLRHALTGAVGVIPFGRLPGLPLRLEGPVTTDRQLRLTLVATRVLRRRVAEAEVSVPPGYALRPFDPRGPIPGVNLPVGLSPR